MLTKLTLDHMLTQVIPKLFKNYFTDIPSNLFKNLYKDLVGFWGFGVLGSLM